MKKKNKIIDPTAAEKFDDFDNAFILFDKIKIGVKSKMQDAKTNQNRFKLDLNKTRKEILKRNKQIKALYKIQMYLLLLNFLMIILQWYLNQYMN